MSCKLNQVAKLVDAIILWDEMYHNQMLTKNWHNYLVGRAYLNILCLLS